MPQAVWERIAGQLREQIADGEREPGSRLPSESELAAEHGVSRPTARHALNSLVDAGLATGGQGQVRRVRDRRPIILYASRSESLKRRVASSLDAWKADVKEQGREPDQLIKVEIEPAGPWIGRWLGLAETDLVAVRRRLRTVDGDPSDLNDTYYSMAMTRQVPEILDPADVPEGIVTRMHDRYGIKQVKYDDHLRWRQPTPHEAKELKIDPGVTVLVVTHTGYTGDGEPVKTTVTVMPGDRYEMIYEVPA